MDDDIMAINDSDTDGQAIIASITTPSVQALRYISTNDQINRMRAHSPGGNPAATIGSGPGREYSLFDKLNTMSRVRRRKQEADELAAEARQAMEDPLHPIQPEIGPVGYQLTEGEECSMIEPFSKVSTCPAPLPTFFGKWDKVYPSQFDN
ncbi:unnamed protein product [Schistocephalus solidus]|uniref:PRP1_N domain-containing protein n=1 Tax=Schistocephalus solidus TaxID=70667 RepID=A0A183TEZ4_SCHSO|nr:unnamed protein product [Schistocephalus solidus]